ncbi:MAG TPA: type III pantothenate kinase [Opitutae bacterium]|nr:pantothenate kinase [Opitutaceae bacterium]HCR30571.1 type III pantothenate kinase [Opitutae bacterium]|tara:strand:- start:217 stop:1029 length:813 start_codon:yes stop_codon:yes gene_type:complete
MNLCIDVGNSQLHGAVYRHSGELKMQLRKESSNRVSSDEMGLFLVSALREKGIDPGSISRIGISCVVPEETHTLRVACREYFNTEPLFLEAGVKTKLKIKTRNPLEVGADRIANAIAASELYPNGNVVVVDFGTAITVDAVSVEREYLGGAICAGLVLAMEALGTKTAKLPHVEIVRTNRALGKSSIESIQNGLYFGYLGLVRELVGQIGKEAFGLDSYKTIATGGYSQLYRDENLFDEIIPDLVLQGVNTILKLNPIEGKPGPEIVDRS